MDEDDKFPLTADNKLVHFSKYKRNEETQYCSVRKQLQQKYSDLLSIKKQYELQKPVKSCCLFHVNARAVEEERVNNQILKALKRRNINIEELPPNCNIIQKYKSMAIQKKRKQYEQLVRRADIIKKLLNERKQREVQNPLLLPKATCSLLSTIADVQRAELQSSSSESLFSTNVTDDVFIGPLTGSPEETPNLSERRDLGGQSIRWSEGSKCLCHEDAQPSAPFVLLISPIYPDLLQNKEVETGVVATPDVIKFQNFRSLHSYKKKFTLLNNAVEIMHIRFYVVKYLNDELDPKEITVNPQTQLWLAPGLSQSYEIHFKPRHIYNKLDAEVYFLTEQRFKASKKTGYFMMKVFCTAEQLTVTVKPTNINFNNIPIWQLYDEYLRADIEIKNLSISNISNIDCVFSIYKESIPIEEDSIFSGDELTNQQLADDLFMQCFDSVFEPFRFPKQYFYKLPGHSTEVVPIYFIQATHIGHHQSMYTLQFRDDYTEELLHEETIQIFCRTTSVPIEIDKMVIDFKICEPDCFTYKEFFNIMNKSRSALTVLLKVPIEIENSVSIFPENTFIQSCATNRITVYFSPKLDLLNCSCFSLETNVIEFPIYIFIVNFAHTESPPVIVMAYAMLSHGITIRPQHIHLGHVSTQESVTANIHITNESILFQTSVFPNLPDCITIGPVYGIAEMLPKETVTYVLYFSPSSKDIRDDILCTPGKQVLYTTEILCTTVSNLGCNRSKNKRTFRSSSFDSNLIVPSEVVSVVYENSEFDADFRKSTAGCISFTDIQNGETQTIVLEEDYVPEEEEIISMGPIRFVNKLTISAFIYDPVCEFSEQVLIFADCPMDSTSTSSVMLRAFNRRSVSLRYCGNPPSPPTEATESFDFEITLNCDNIEVSPRTGRLKKGAQTGIRFLVEPVLGENDVLNRALEIKKDIILGKRRELARLKWIANQVKIRQANERALAKQLAKERAKNKGKPPVTPLSAVSVPLPEPIPEPTDDELVISYEFTEKELLITPIELQEAELNVYQTMVSTQQTSNALCLLRSSNGLELLLRLKLMVNITAPEFLRLNTKKVFNFGPVVIGTSKQECFDIQNISGKNITPRVTVTNPGGSINCFIPTAFELETEHMMSIPINFSPKQENTIYEFVTIFTNVTSFTFAVVGIGCYPDLTLKPEFKIARLDVKGTKPVSCGFEVVNNTQAEMPLRLDVMYEIVGYVTDPPPPPEPPAPPPPPSIKGKKPPKPPKTPKPKKKDKFSIDFYEDETYSLENNEFKSVGGELEVFSASLLPNDILKPNEKKAFKMTFKSPEIEPPKPPASPNSNKKGSSPKSDTTGGGEPPEVIQPGVKTYVAKYRLLLGKSTVLKEFVLICSIK